MAAAKADIQSGPYGAEARVEKRSPLGVPGVMSKMSVATSSTYELPGYSCSGVSPSPGGVTSQTKRNEAPWTARIACTMRRQ